MENAYLATKVTFCNEMYDIAQAYGIDYDELREIWLLDPRINRSHTFVYEDDRGYGGSCFPKDMSALKKIAEDKNVECLLISDFVHQKYINNVVRIRESDMFSSRKIIRVLFQCLKINGHDYLEG